MSPAPKASSSPSFKRSNWARSNDRPQIAAALAACRLRHATLVIAKLDRLARNVHFISTLMESGVDFVACDNPHATRLTIHILAAVAEHEREMISARTIAALAAAKARGVKLGNPKLRPGDRRAARTRGMRAAIRRRACRRRPALYRARPQSRLRLIGRARPRAFRLRHPHAGRRPRVERGADPPHPVARPVGPRCTRRTKPDFPDSYRLNKLPTLRPLVSRLEAALDGEPPSAPCPLVGGCALGSATCRIFAPGWYCEDRDLVVFPELLRDADDEPDCDDEPNGDDEPDDDYV